MGAKKAAKFLGIRAYARYRGCSHTSVEEAIDNGRIVSVSKSGRKVSIDVKKADAEWKANTFEGNARGKDGDSVFTSESSPSNEVEKSEMATAATYREARAKREDLQAQMLQMELELKSGRLIRADEVEQKAFEDGRRVKNAIMGLPDRLAPLLASETDVTKCHNILVKEFTNMLRGLAREIREGK